MRKASITVCFTVLLSITAVWASPSSWGYTVQDQDAAINSYIATFYAQAGDTGNFVMDDTKRDYPDGGSFWRMAEKMEVVEDAYDRTHDDKYKAMIVALYYGFIRVNRTNWLGNWYNDDLMWITMATIRAYEITGDEQYLTQAKSCFDSTWDRAYDPVNGGVWWSTEKKSKNACIAGPAAIAALLLYRNGAGDRYLDDAKTAFTWELQTLYKPSGCVQDNISADGKLSGGATTYNQGTFIGAAYLLDKATSTHNYEPFALAAARYTRDHYSERGKHHLLANEYSAGHGDSDNAGFKGVFARWCGLWARETGNKEILSWLRSNAQTVVKHRNKAGLTWGIWDQPTPDSSLTSWECSDAVALLQDVSPR